MNISDKVLNRLRAHIGELSVQLAVKDAQLEHALEQNENLKVAIAKLSPTDKEPEQAKEQ